ncbi:hypothetical protein FRC09_014807 [Ceratobasidium sp. 395]|nr:hypothetical protein FRC09_014807 [Ceratobasidium sp. 395]
MSRDGQVLYGREKRKRESARGGSASLDGEDEASILSPPRKRKVPLVLRRVTDEDDENVDEGEANGGNGDDKGVSNEDAEGEGEVQDAAHLEPMYDDGVPLYWT